MKMVSSYTHHKEPPRPFQEPLQQQPLQQQQDPDQLQDQCDQDTDTFDPEYNMFADLGVEIPMQTEELNSASGLNLVLGRVAVAECFDASFTEILTETNISIIDVSFASGDASIDQQIEGLRSTWASRSGMAGASRYETISPEPFNPPAINVTMPAREFRDVPTSVDAADEDDWTAFALQPLPLLQLDINQVVPQLDWIDEVSLGNLVQTKLPSETKEVPLLPSPGGSASALYRAKLARRRDVGLENECPRPVSPAPARPTASVERAPHSPSRPPRKRSLRDPRLRGQRDQCSDGQEHFPTGNSAPCLRAANGLLSVASPSILVAQSQNAPKSSLFSAVNIENLDGQRAQQQQEEDVPPLPGFSVEEPVVDMPAYATCEPGWETTSRRQRRRRQRRQSKRSNRFARLKAIFNTEGGIIGTPTSSLGQLYPNPEDRTGDLNATSSRGRRYQVLQKTYDLARL
jgi:hypothetical protein